MKKLVLLSLLLASLHARADLVITLQTAEPRFDPQTITIKIKGDKYRTDISQKFSSIADLVSDDIIVINHAAKTYWKIPGARIKAQNAPVREVDPKAPVAPATAPALIDTGKTEKIGDYDAEVYTAHNAYATYTYWVTKDYPDYALVSEELKKIQAMNAGLNKTDPFSPDLSKLDGLVLKFQQMSASGKSTTTTLVSAKIQPVDEAELHAPDGYTETSGPGQPAVTPAPAQEK